MFTRQNYTRKLLKLLVLPDKNQTTVKNDCLLKQTPRQFHSKLHLLILILLHPIYNIHALRTPENQLGAIALNLQAYF